ncbi:hypothetical protein CSV72_09110 [Sporosarcina sp. P20a]|uniref:hypothetical protein n=1 Tax=Sporosarcina sp. P20a TaxID=2048256 RepID=UPI000C1659AF|nr:hypothetical protein [Sporosarcina sp. P20a]PIC86310.1 hypothetical protein CSV72_09110 [Sporosarcina sp. P20a]
MDSDKIEPEKTDPVPKVVNEDIEKSDMKIIDNDLKKEFEKEEGVSELSLVITEDAGGFILLDFEVDEDMKQEEAKLITKRYYERLEKEYSAYSIDIQARKSGETFVHETKEVK